MAVSGRNSGEGIGSAFLGVSAGAISGHQSGSDHAAVSGLNHHALSTQPAPDTPASAQAARASNAVVAPIRFGMD